MSSLTRENLAKIRSSHVRNENEILVSMGTCGIAAGAEEIYKILSEETKQRQINIAVKKAGCFGLCFCEPNLIVKVQGMPEIVYGYVTPEVAEKIVTEHIVQKNILNDYVIFFPAEDSLANIMNIMDKKEQ